MPRTLKSEANDLAENWSGSFKGEPDRWDLLELKQLLVTHGATEEMLAEQPKHLLVQAVEAVLDELCEKLSVKSMSCDAMKGMDLDACPAWVPSSEPFDADPDVMASVRNMMEKAHPHLDLDQSRKAGFVEQAFNSSFTLEEHQKYRDLGDALPLGRDPYLDLRQNLMILSKGFDSGGLLHCFQRSDTAGRQTHALAVRLDRVVDVGGRPGIVIQFSYHTAAEMQASPEIAQEVFKVLRPPIQNSRCTQRELEVLVKYLDDARKQLNLRSVLKIEKRWNGGSRKRFWRVTVVTPVAQPTNSQERAFKYKRYLKTKFVCASCGKTEADAAKLSACAGCGTVRYCSAECQKADWKQHKPTCEARSSTTRQAAASDSEDKADSGVAGVRFPLQGGDRVMILDLTSADHLNGEAGVLTQWDADTTRWSVLLDRDRSQKRVRPDNLWLTNATTSGSEPPITPVSQLAAGSSKLKKLAEESSEDFAVEPFTRIPIEQLEPDTPEGQHSVQLLNGDVVQPNAVKSDIHRGRVFITKLQITFRGEGADRLMMYDATRSLLLYVYRESCCQGFLTLRAVTVESGIVCSHRHSGKIYLYAKREGASLRVYTKRLPPQIQPF